MRLLLRLFIFLLVCLKFSLKPLAQAGADGASGGGGESESGNSTSGGGIPVVHAHTAEPPQATDKEVEMEGSQRDAQEGEHHEAEPKPPLLRLQPLQFEEDQANSQVEATSPTAGSPKSCRSDGSNATTLVMGEDAPKADLVDEQAGKLFS